MTNGAKIIATFPNTTFDFTGEGVHIVYKESPDKRGKELDAWFSNEWWNATYCDAESEPCLCDTCTNPCVKRDVERVVVYCTAYTPEKKKGER